MAEFRRLGAKGFCTRRPARRLVRTSQFREILNYLLAQHAKTTSKSIQEERKFIDDGFRLIR